MSDLPAFTKLLGVNFLHRSPERSEAELTVREDLCNRRGVLHGGAVMALGDTLGGMTARSGLPDGGGTATFNLFPSLSASRTITLDLPSVTLDSIAAVAATTPSGPSGARSRRITCASCSHGGTFGVYMIAVARTRPARRRARRRSGPFVG